MPLLAFNLGPMEIVILGACLGLPALGALAGLLVYLLTRRPDDRGDGGP
jgi:hypothetical protein